MIQYSGNARLTTFTPTVKQDIINDVETALLAAGWTTISGHATTNLLMQSATTPQGYAINVRLKDNGGTCVTFSLESTDGTLVGGNSTTVGGGFLNPGSGYVYNVIACKYQAFIYVTPDLGLSRTFVAFGVPFVPSWNVSLASRLGWMQGNAYEDADTTVRPSFRTGMWVVANTFIGSQQAMYDSVLWSANSASGAAYWGQIALASFFGYIGNTAGGLWRYENGSAFILDALIFWSDASTATEGKCQGQLWDAFLSMAQMTGDQTGATPDGHNYIVVTDNNSGSIGLARGTLMVATS